MSKKMHWFWVLAPGILILVIGLGGCKKDTPTGPGETGIELSGRIQDGTAGAAGTSGTTEVGMLSVTAPVSGVDVYLSWGGAQKTATASDGSFAFKNLPAGNYIITPSRKGFAFNPSNYEAGATTRKDLNFTAAAASTGTEVNNVARNFTANNQSGQSVSLWDHHGKVVLLDFTADWCTPCREKAETAEAFYQQFRDKGFMYILVVIDGDPANWANTYKLTFPVLNDNSQAIYNHFRKTSIPLPHVLDRNMTIRYKKEGWNKSEVEDVIRKYL
ncbi:MAG: redoxin domain-containing protein [Acidobacteriota bacterium]|nr:redoxin domain-containing protein [Acidobacteriota bacterium]